MKKQEIKYQLLPRTTTYQSKTTIFIGNLDQGISEDYLYHKFKEVGEIKRLEIRKDKITQKSKGFAFITFVNPDSAEEARKKFNNQIFIRNCIRVKPCFNYPSEDIRANILINNIPENTDTMDVLFQQTKFMQFDCIFELEQEFYRFGTIKQVEIHKDNQGKQLNYGYVQFEKKEDADNLIKRVTKYPIIYKGKLLYLQQFKDQSYKKVESNSIYLRNFAKPIQQKYLEQEKPVRAIEYGWSLIIKDYFTKNGIQLKDCLVKIDKNSRQPWTIITFKTSEQAKINLDICEKQRNHPCVNSDAYHALELINKYGPPVNNDASLPFSIAEITQGFKDMAQDHNDTFKGESENFFYNMVQRQQLNPNEKVLLVQNIKDDVTKEQIQNFLSGFGKVIHIVIRKIKNPICQVQECLVYYLTLEDSKRARSEFHDQNNAEISKKKKQIFQNGHGMMNILLSKNIKKEVNEVKKENQGVFQVQGGKQFPQIPIGKNFMIMPPKMSSPQVMRFFKGAKDGSFHLTKTSLARNPFTNNKLIVQTPIKKEVQFGSYIQEFYDYEVVQNRMEEFLRIPIEDQRQVLGNLLFAKIFEVAKDKETTKKVVFMLIDPLQFEICDILNLFKDNQELQTYADEGIQYIKQRTQK